jgi:hypothetical protein
MKRNPFDTNGASDCSSLSHHPFIIMRVTSFVVAATALSAPALAASVPSLNVPACPAHGTIKYTKTVPSTDKTPFPATQVDLCYGKSALSLTFTAYNETNFFFNPNYTTNEAIYEYEVMEAFIARGNADPATYLELEVAPNNVTYSSFIYNPSKVRAPGTPFDHGNLDGPTDGITSITKLDKKAKVWTSKMSVPLALFNVDNGTAKGTTWRMNFFRTVVAPATFPNQGLGAWSPPSEASFHQSPFFGKVTFV